jgi:transcriptional regulator with XRE-family HTH domain
MSEKNKPKVKAEIHELCRAVKAIRLAYGDTQERFAQRVSLSSMTVSRFELGKAVPRDPQTLQRLFDAAAGHGGLKTEASLLEAARRDAAQARPIYDRFTPFADQMIPFHSLEEWRVMCAARIAARYHYDEAIAIRKAAPKSMEIVDAVLADTNASEGIHEAFYDDLEERLTELAEQRTIERLQEERKK